MKKIINVRLNSKRVISEFLIGDAFKSQWVSKPSAIALAEQGQLHAIAIHAKFGTYLRPEYHARPFRELLC